MPPDRSIYLIGYRGTGKSTVARLLAERLGCDWVDADEVLQQRAGRTIAEIFASDGEAAFRDLEQQVIADLAAGPPQIVALGGGAILREANRQAIEGTPVVWLTASPQVLAQRLAGDERSSSQRPNLTDKGLLGEIEQVLAERTPIYQQCATLTIDTEVLAPAEVTKAICHQLFPT